MSGVRGPRPYGRMPAVPNAGQVPLPISTQRPTSSDPCATIAQCLMMYHTGIEEEFSRKAIESLIKKLKDKRDELDALIATVTSQGKIAARCITIQRTLDGRLQVAGRKGFPHVVYAKIWRWPDLHKNELKDLPNCQYAFDLKCDLVCVNPYHYERVVPPGIGTLDLSKLKIEHRASQDDPTTLSPTSEDSPSTSRTGDGSDVVAQQLSYASASYTPPNVRIPEVESGTQSAVLSLCTTEGPWLGVNEPTPVASHSRPHPLPVVDHTVSGVPPICTPSLMNPYGTAPVTSVSPIPASPLLFDSSGPPQSSSAELGPMTEGRHASSYSRQPPPPHWCTITYYEHTTRIDRSFLASTPEVFVDGGIGTGPGRFCVNGLQNIQRTELSERCRHYIGRGVLLELKDEGDVYLTNLLIKNCVYVHSSLLDKDAPGKQPYDGVARVLPNASLKIFDLKYSYDSLRKKQACQMVGRDSENALQLSEMDRTEAANIGLDELQQFCNITVSFIKGWGPDYPRKSVGECPCWIEIQISRAFQLLDELLHTPSPS